MARAQARRFTGTASARRRRAWARTDSVVTGLTIASPTPVDLLAVFRAIAGGSQLGSTVGAVNLHIRTRRTAGAGLLPYFNWGLIVAPQTMDPADLDPRDFTGAAGAHADWMWWDAQTVAPGNTITSERYRVKSMRKLEEVGQTLFFSASTVTLDTYDLGITASTLLLLP